MNLDNSQFRGRKAAVVGAGGSGWAAARLLARLGAGVRLLEKDEWRVKPSIRRQAAEEGIEFVFGMHRKEDFKGADLVVPSPGFALSRLRKILGRMRPEIMAEIELAFRCVQKPILAVTGTNGKTTTVSLAAHILRSAGKKVFLGGNIGTPLSEYVLSGDEADVLVLELSSFQLQTCSSFKPWAGVLLNFSEDHQDYHADMEEYFRAKLKLFENQDQDDLAVIPLELKRDVLERIKIKARTVFLERTDRFVSDRLIGVHNRMNMEAAYQGCRFFGVTETEAQRAIASFDPLPHRLERVLEKNGLLFVNDSKATTVDSLKAALKSFDRPIRLLAGGVYKGGDLKGLLPLMKEKVREVGLFGASQDVFKRAWNGGGLDVFWEPTMELAMRRLISDAGKGEVILLSPATASFDLYSDYKARGEDFKRLARELS